MRKYGLIAAAAGLALSGSLARADFIISSTRTALNGTQDKVSFFVLNDSTGQTAGTGGALAAADTAIFAPTSFNGQSYPNNGLFITVNPSTFNATITPGAALSTVGITGFGVTGRAVLKLDQVTVDTAPQTGGHYTVGQQVAGIGSSGFGSADASSPLLFATAIVPTGDPVIALQPVAGKASVTVANTDGNRTILTNFDAGANSFSADNVVITTATNARSSSFSDPVAIPEPASLGLVGIALGGLVARRRRTA